MEPPPLAAEAAVFHKRGLLLVPTPEGIAPSVSKAAESSPSRGRSRSIPPQSENGREPQAQAQGKLLFFQLSVDRLPDYVCNNNSPHYQHINYCLSPLAGLTPATRMGGRP